MVVLEHLSLAVGLMLPDDATQTSLNGDTCEVWQSAKLKLMTGVRYAALTTAAGADTADARAEPAPGC